MFSDLDQDGILTIGGENSEILQENHYYAFGMAQEGNWAPQLGVKNQYTYNGKELNEDFGLNWLDYGARWYDPSIARWNAVDPLAEMYYQSSPYAYVENNPLRFIDPNGMHSENAMFKAAKEAHGTKTVFSIPGYNSDGTPEGEEKQTDPVEKFRANAQKTGHGDLETDALATTNKGYGADLSNNFSKEIKDFAIVIKSINGELVLEIVLPEEIKFVGAEFDEKRQELINELEQLPKAVRTPVKEFLLQGKNNRGYITTVNIKAYRKIYQAMVKELRKNDVNLNRLNIKFDTSPSGRLKNSNKPLYQSFIFFKEDKA